MRSWLFVPGNRPDMMAKAARTGADTLILDLEDSVRPADKDRARRDTAEALSSLDRRGQLWVRVNPLEDPRCAEDLAMAQQGGADGIVLPKSLSGQSVRRLADMMAEAGGPVLPVLAIATETAAALFGLGSYGEAGEGLAGLAWGAEDLSADLGSSISRDEAGALTGPFSLARNMMLAGAAAAGCQAVDTVWTDIRDLEGLRAECMAARRDGFTGKMAIHPAQIPVINESFMPTPDELAMARRIIEAFAADGVQGAINIDGQMIDMPHLRRAERLVRRAQGHGAGDGG